MTFLWKRLLCIWNPLFQGLPARSSVPDHFHSIPIFSLSGSLFARYSLWLAFGSVPSSAVGTLERVLKVNDLERLADFCSNSKSAPGKPGRTSRTLTGGYWCRGNQVYCRSGRLTADIVNRRTIPGGLAKSRRLNRVGMDDRLSGETRR